ncbi:MAG: hypothetical protein JSU74_13205 [Candidatus Zixiibacteriota bacterium]|nr:MAG: hypothetical protein JSU74_13205 [candidate division Zixibacteria bacterium]
MVKFLAPVLLVLLLATSSTIAADGVRCHLALFQYDSHSQADVLLYEDTAVFAKDLPATGFIGPLSIEVEFKSIDTAQVAFNAHIVTLGPPVNTFSRSFTMEYQLPARLGGIEGKHKSQYALVITPVAAVELEEGCLIDYRAADAFTSMPAAYFDLYFVPSSLGDYLWESTRGYFDFEYRRFQTFAGFTLPGKMFVYLCPCPTYSVIWDRRFGMAVDPTRNNCFSIFTSDVNTADPFVVLYTMVLRNLGYAPPFIAEGLANYFSLTLHDMKQILAERPDFTVEPMLATYNYLTADPIVADRTAACFVKYLIDQYNLSNLTRLYQAADDLNIKSKIEEIYQKPFSQLEAEFFHWVDTVNVGLREYHAAARLAQQMFNYELMLRYAGELMPMAATQSDTMRSLTMLRQANFFTGDYYRADSLQGLIIEMNTADATAWMARGSYRMMNGYYDEAYTFFDKAHSLDPSNGIINLNLALNHFYRGQLDTARVILENNISTVRGAMAQGETRILLGNILIDSGNVAERDTAKQYFSEALAGYQQSLSLNRSSANHYMWMGIAMLGIDDAGGAVDYLKMADFLETRPFYIGMTNLWLGKAYARLGQDDKAHDHLAKVLSVASADYHQREAQRYLEQM